MGFCWARMHAIHRFGRLGEQDYVHCETNQLAVCIDGRLLFPFDAPGCLPFVSYGAGYRGIIIRR